MNDDTFNPKPNRPKFDRPNSDRSNSDRSNTEPNSRRDSDDFDANENQDEPFDESSGDEPAAQQSIGEKIRARNRQRDSRNPVLKFFGNVSINEAIGYLSALVFFGIAIFIYAGGFGNRGWDMKYRWTIITVLILYGLYRAIITRTKANTIRRRKAQQSRRFTQQAYIDRE
ncbi:MAG: hypothetical protein IAF08_09075 [Rhizobacter sp.]|nr:hypothetical protein [Chlorobiales bacterium]